MSLQSVSSGKGILAVLVCGVLALTAVVGLSRKAAAAEPEPTYLVFMVGGETDSPTNPNLPPSVQEVKDRFGARPSGSTRYIGFTPGLVFSLNLSVETLRSLVNQALDVAEQTDMPVFFHLDDMHFWWKRTELHKDPSNVEWSDFPAPGQSHGPVIERYWLNWGQFVVFPAPPPNYESPAFRADVADHLTNGIGKPIAERLAKWRSEGCEYLFAGIGMGNETEVPVDLRPLVNIPEGKEPEGQDGSHQTPEKIKMRRDEMVIGGYHALAMRGWTREKMAQTAKEQGISEEQLLVQLRHEVAQDYAEFRAKTLLDAGIPSNRLYTHFVSPFLPFIERYQPGMVSRFPPVKYAVNPWSRPGFTVTRDQVDLEDLTKQVHEARQRQKKEGSLVSDFHWGVIESYVGTGQPGRPQTKDEYSAFLGGVFSHGATLVNLYGWGGPKDNPFSVQGAPGVAEAVADWASGKPLPTDWKGTKPEHAQLQDPGMRLGGKMNQLQQMQAKRRKAGEDVSQIDKIMTQVGTLMQSGKLDEAEKLIDRAIAAAQSGKEMSQVSSPPSGQPGQPSASLGQKVRGLHEHLQAWISSGGDTSKIGPLVQRLQTLMQSGNQVEAEKVVDEILAIVAPAEPTDSARAPARKEETPVKEEEAAASDQAQTDLPAALHEANWIWCQGEAVPENFYLYCRKSVTFGERPAHASVHVTADSRYKLFINGQFVGQSSLDQYTTLWRA